MPDKKTLLVTYAALLIAVVGWGSSFVATKVALETLRPTSLVFFRLAAAAIFFFVLVRLRHVPRPPRRDLLRLVMLALFEPVLYFLLETQGLALTSASSGALVIAAVPVFVALFARLFLSERMRALGWIGTAISIAGVVLLVLGDDNPDYSATSVWGNLLVLGAALSASGYIVLARSLSGRTHPLQISFFQMLVGALCFTPLFAYNTVATGLPVFTPAVAWALVFLTLVATIAAFLCYNYALSQIPAAKAAVFLNGIPLVTAVVAAIILGEELTWLQAGAGLVIIVGVVMAGVRRRGRQAAPVATQ
ncbi:MAG: DMT family transporter [Spirochaetales bacterium]